MLSAVQVLRHLLLPGQRLTHPVAVAFATTGRQGLSLHASLYWEIC